MKPKQVNAVKRCNVWQSQAKTKDPQFLVKEEEI
jgi:hypothetical protein